MDVILIKTKIFNLKQHTKNYRNISKESLKAFQAFLKEVLLHLLMFHLNLKLNSAASLYFV